MWDKDSNGKDMDSKCMCGCGCNVCGMEPRTKEDKLAFLDRKEAYLKQKLQKIQKIRDDVKSGKSSMKNNDGDKDENE